MKTVICNSLQSFWDIFLSGVHVHCVFPASESLKMMLIEACQRHQIRNITFTKAFSNL